jgi:hypothetical protein
MWLAAAVAASAGTDFKDLQSYQRCPTNQTHERSRSARLNEALTRVVSIDRIAFDGADALPEL